MRSYLKGSFPAMRDVDDVVQESYLRICKAHTAHPIQCARAFLFGIARRLAVDVLRKERRTTAHNVSLGFGAFDVREDKVDAAEAASTQQEVELLAEAIHALPARCREVMVLRKIERLSHREIAEKLGITIGTVEAQIARGMEKCTCYLRSRGVAIIPRGSST
ncbi:MAG: sigma-70 family RNA polymerase sigma factor [Opitutaceae bacterium]|nr:sigma-70 family RNA polymerase sigma factor [Opitutaceae bacterium]